MDKTKGNCSSCKHKEVKYFKEGSYEEIYCGAKEPGEPYIKVNDPYSILGNRYYLCHAGFTEKLIQYYAENGKKTVLENESVFVDCYVRPEHLAKLDNMLEATEKMIQILNRRYDKETND